MYHPIIEHREQQCTCKYVYADFPGSPSWYRNNLQDLLAVVKQRGMPHRFLTLTADEVCNTFSFCETIKPWIAVENVLTIATCVERNK